MKATNHNKNSVANRDATKTRTDNNNNTLIYNRALKVTTTKPGRTLWSWQTTPVYNSEFQFISIQLNT